MELGVQYSLVQMRGETQYLFVMQMWGETQYNIIRLSCNLTLNLWRRVKLSTCDICLLCNLCKWGVKQCSYATCANEGWNSVQYFVMQLVQMKSNLCKWEVKLSRIFINFVMQLVQMRGETQYNILLCNLCRSQMRGGTQCNIHLLCNLCRWGVEHSTMFICVCNLCRWGWFMQWNSGCNVKLPWQPSFSGQ